MLFSDIEGSTALLSRLGDRYLGALLEELLVPARAAVSSQVWDAELAAGRAHSQPETLALSPAHHTPA